MQMSEAKAFAVLFVLLSATSGGEENGKPHVGFCDGLRRA